MDLSTQTSLFGAIVSLALAISMLLRSQRARSFTLFAVLCLACAAWYLADFLWSITGTPFWLRAAIATGALLPPAVMAFFLEFLGVSRASARRGRNLAFAGAVCGLAVAFTPLAHMPAARVALTAWIFGGMGIPLSLLLRRRREVASLVERQRLAYLFFGGLAALLASAFDFLPFAGIPFPSLGPIVAVLYLFFLSQTLLVYRLLDLNELLGRFATLSLLALILSAIYGGLVLWVGGRVGLFLFNTLVASFVILNLVEPLRTKVEGWVTATLFRERFELIQTLSQLKIRLAGIIDPLELARACLDTFHESRRITHASIYLLADTRPGFSLIDSRGPSPTVFLDAGAARGLLATARGGQKAVLLENVERRQEEIRRALGRRKRAEAADLALRGDEASGLAEEKKRLGELRSALSLMKAGICIPLLGADRVIGFLNLADERVPEAFSSDEIALMLEIAEQLATVVENSKLYERMRERDRLAALGEMAAGLAHEIRNPLGAIKGAAQFLSPSTLEEEDGEILHVIVEEVDRLNGVVTQFLDYARPVKSSPAPVDVNDVVERTLKLLLADLPPDVEVETSLDPSDPQALSDAEQLKQVLMNLVQNAAQAMPEGGKLTVLTSSTFDDPAGFHLIGRGADFVELRVRDTGPGLADEQREHVFVPFYTTKKRGTGLGLAISQRIVRSHGGIISVQSRQGEGTEFLVRLPVAERQRKENPQGSEATEANPS